MGRGHTSADNRRRRPQLGDEDVSDARKEEDKKGGGEVQRSITTYALLHLLPRLKH